MPHPLLPLLIAVAAYSVPSVNLHAVSKDPMSCMKNNPGTVIIAADQGTGPAHGDDPNDEKHPDPYGGQAPGTDPYGGNLPGGDPYGGQFPH
jgi:hypothetical protein